MPTVSIILPAYNEEAVIGRVVESILAGREEGLELKRQAVLFRGSHHSDRLEIELVRRNIPYVKYGGLKFLEAAHVKDVLAILKWAENPKNEVAAFRVLKLLPGMGPRHAHRCFRQLAAGSIGTYALQLARRSGAEVTGVDSAGKLDMVSALGADHVIDYTKQDFTRNGQTYDLIFDVKSDRSVFNYQRALCQDGTYVTVGGKTSRILGVALFGKLTRKYRMHALSYKPNKDSNYLVELFEADKLKPVIDKRFPLEKTAEAFRFFGEGRFKGKIVVSL